MPIRKAWRSNMFNSAPGSLFQQTEQWKIRCRTGAGGIDSIA
jgi:hypothetical protein